MADPVVNILLKATDQTSGALNGLGGKLGGLGKIALGLAAGGLAAVTGAMAGGIATTINWGNQLDTLQDLLGTTAEESAGLAVMANRVGLSSEDLGRSLSIMTRGLFDAEGAAGPAGKAIEGLGISVTDAAGNTKDSTTLFQEIADVIAKMPDGFEKSSLMMDIFGRSGVEMGDLLAEAADGGLAAFRAEAEQLGLSFSQEKIDNIIKFGKQTELLKSTMQGIGATIGNAVLPYVSMFLDKVQMLVGPLMDAGLFSSEFKEALGSLVGDDTAGALLEFLQKLFDWMGVNIPKAIQAASDMWSNVLLPALIAVWTWMSTVLFPFLADVVYPWLATNIPIAVQFLSDVWTKVLQPALEAVWTWMSTVLIPFLVDVVYPWLQENIPKAIRFLKDMWTNVLLPALKAVWDFLKVLIAGWQSVVDFWKAILNPAIQFLAGMWNTILKPALEAVWAFIRDYLIPLFSALWQLFSEVGRIAVEGLVLLWNTKLKPALELVWKFISEKVIPILSELWTWFSDKIGPIIMTLVNGALSRLRQIFKDIRDAIQWVIDKVLALIEKLKLIKMPKLTLPGVPSPESADFTGNSIRAGSLAATNRLTVYGGLHLHGVESGGDLLTSLNSLMIG